MRFFSFKIISILLIILVFCQRSFAQDMQNAAIKKLEQLEAVSIQKGDTTTLLRLWSKDFVCNNPYGYIVTPKQIIGFIRQGMIDYSYYNREVERITFTGDLAIVMGKEIVKPQNKTPGAGNTITMRYTHVWVNDGGVWKLIARQTSNF